MREQKIVSIIEDGNELTFRVTQMPATKAERWLNRALSALAGAASGNASLSGLQQRLAGEKALEELFKIFGALDYEKVEPLYNELLECCEHIPEKNNLNFSTPCSQATIDGIVGDPMTLYRLRLEALKLNFSFFQKGRNARSPKEPLVTFPKTIRT